MYIQCIHIPFPDHCNHTLCSVQRQWNLIHLLRINLTIYGKKWLCSVGFKGEILPLLSQTAWVVQLAHEATLCMACVQVMNYE